MLRIANSMLWVHDQDEALEFYTKKVGFEVRADVTLAELGNFRWLTVGPPNQPDFAVQLMEIPGPPVMDAETAEQVRTVMAKGWGGTIFLVTDDIQSDVRAAPGPRRGVLRAPRGASLRDRLRHSATRRATASGSRS